MSKIRTNNVYNFFLFDVEPSATPGDRAPPAAREMLVARLGRSPVPLRHDRIPREHCLLSSWLRTVVVMRVRCISRVDVYFRVLRGEGGVLMSARTFFPPGP
jgi:hypothetical protein